MIQSESKRFDIIKSMSIDKSQYSPMMQHYLELKEEHPDEILFYRLGDFYEMFFEDAVTVSRELDLVLTGKNAGAEKAPMCGIPHRAYKSYVSRLVKKGYKVAICEQLEDPKASKGLVKRGIVKIITPGTLLEDENNRQYVNYLGVVATDSWKALLLLCELSTGELRYIELEKSLSQLQNLLNEFEVKELIAPRNLNKTWQKALEQSPLVFSLQQAKPLAPEDESLLPVQDPLMKSTLEVLMGYLQSTQMQHADHLSPMTPMFPSTAMVLDPETRLHLELTRSLSSNAHAQSLWAFMDQTQSALGSRLLREWIEAPLLDPTQIMQRQDAVQTLLDQFLVRTDLRDHLAYIYDLERLAARISYRSASPRDVLQLSTSLEHAAPILEMAQCLTSYPGLKDVPDCHELYEQIKSAIVPEPPLTTKDGDFIAPGYNEKLDEIRRYANESDQALRELEERERERTGIKALKIGYNRVFGYYIEVRKTSLDQILPEYGYVQKQTLANASRFTFDELKQLEEKILSAQDQKILLEQEIFDQLLDTIKENLATLHELSKALALIDVLCSLANLASERGYIRPVFSSDRNVEVIEGRHPILEARMSGFVSNNWLMPTKTDVCLVTGPNMGGKSTWLRQNALLVVMAQMGSFIPARQATLPIFDRIFTRIGASDDLLQGKSTFMMEMMEANNALRHATENSLILFDEIGRGTATFDGMALAQSMMEYIVQVLKSKTLFSTHYHELTTLDQDFQSIQNVHVDVQEKRGDIRFLYRIVDGKADKSYGIHVAKLAGLPPLVISRASALLEQFEQNNPNQNFQPSLFVMDPKEVERLNFIEEVKNIDPDELSAKEALDLIYSLKTKAEKVSD